MWKVQLVRQLTDKVSPDVIVESSFDYELPADWSAMLDSAGMVEQEYQDSIFEGVLQHCIEEFGPSGFYPRDLVAPE